MCSKTWGMSRHAQAPSDCYKLRPPAPPRPLPSHHSHPGPLRTLQCHSVCPVCPSCSPPMPPPLPWGCPCPSLFLGAARLPPHQPRTARGHSLVTQDDPLNARPEEDDGADICWAVKEGQKDAESCPPHHQWGTGTPQPSPVGHLRGSTSHSKPTCPHPTVQAQASPEGYRLQRWWQWPGWCPWGWTSGHPAGLRSGWSQP